MARRASQPKELVRLSPLQFSLSVSIVVILLGVAGWVGYYYGIKQSSRPPAEADLHLPEADEPSGPDAAGTETPVTFYSALKEPRKEVPAVPPRRTVEKTAKRVSETPDGPPAPGPVMAAESPGSGSITLQIASYRDEQNARKLLQDLSSEGYKGTVVRADLGERGIWYRVRIGPYPTEEEAGSVLTKLRDERSLKGYIVK